MPDSRDVDPRELRVPPFRPQGADPAKLHRQIARFGQLAAGMPPHWIYEASDGVLVVYNGVTRPNVRIGQLMAHLGFLSEDQFERSLWEIEDDELLAVLHRHLPELIARLQHLPINSPSPQT